MIKTTFGRTGLEVTQLGFGAMELRGPKVWDGREVSDEQAERLLNAVLDAGINFIDTAVDYGLSEPLIGRFISGRRDEYYLATKSSCYPYDPPDDYDPSGGWTADMLWRNITGSLERMRTDYVDVLQLHGPTVEDVRQGKLVEAIKEIQSQGLTRFIGISTRLPHLPEFIEMGVFDVFQIPCSPLDPSHSDWVTAAGEAGAGVVVRGGVARGGPDADVQSQVAMKMWDAARLDELLGDMTAAEMLLRYTLGHPHCHTTIVGTLNADHLAANVAASNRGALPKELHEEIRRRVTDVLVGMQ